LARSGAFLLFGAVFAAVLALLLARRMTKPIRAVERGVARIGDGDFAHRIRIATGDEIERLACRINDMASELAKSQERAERINRLKRFLSPQVAELIESSGADDALSPKRAEVVVVFFDLRGFTAFSAAADAQAVFRLISEYYEVLGGLIREFDATLTHFSGDGVMAVLNAPIPCAEAPDLVAARLACAAQAAMHALLVRWRSEGFELGFGVGFARGWATVGRIGYTDRHDYTAIGNVVNLASRLCSHAGDGQIIVDQYTAAGLAPKFEITALGARDLKGFGDSHSLYAVSRGTQHETR
jgi:class 3 adenylate cyclase